MFRVVVVKVDFVLRKDFRGYIALFVGFFCLVSALDVVAFNVEDVN